MSTLTPREQQLAEIQHRIREYREDAAKCKRIADESMAEAARSNEMADRWESVLDAVRSVNIPNLDVHLSSEAGEVPW